MIEKILDRLERIDHKEYCGGFEFADSSTFEEMGRCFDERKKLANYTKELQQENKQLKEEIEEYKRIEQKDLEAFNNYDSILTELEEYLVKITKNGANIEKITCSNILVYLKELKEKYK